MKVYLVVEHSSSAEFTVENAYSSEELALREAEAWSDRYGRDQFDVREYEVHDEFCPEFLTWGSS